MNGLLGALMAAVLFAVGNIAQKQGMNHLGKKSWKHLLWSPSWLFGMALSCVAILLVYSITAKYELSLVQPVLALNPILSVLIARFWLGEKGNAFLYIALLLGFGGVLVLSRTTPAEGLVPAVGGGAFTFVVLLGMLFFYRSKMLTKAFRFSILSGLGFGMATVLYKVFAVLFLKDVATPFESALKLAKHWSVYAYVVTYCVGFFSSQAALLKGRALLVVPLSAAVGTLTPVLGGFFLFGEQLDGYKGIALVLILLSLGLFAKSLALSESKN